MKTKIYKLKLEFWLSVEKWIKARRRRLINKYMKQLAEEKRKCALQHTA